MAHHNSLRKHNDSHKKIQQFNVKILTENALHQTLQEILKLVSFYTAIQTQKSVHQSPHQQQVHGGRFISFSAVENATVKE